MHIFVFRSRTHHVMIYVLGLGGSGAGVGPNPMGTTMRSLYQSNKVQEKSSTVNTEGEAQQTQVFEANGHQFHTETAAAMSERISEWETSIKDALANILPWNKPINSVPSPQPEVSESVHSIVSSPVMRQPALRDTEEVIQPLKPRVLKQAAPKRVIRRKKVVRKVQAKRVDQ